MSRIFHFILGCSSILIICVLTSNNQKNIRIRFILQTLIVEILLGYFILNSQIGIQSVKGLSYLFNILINFSSEGINFVFGNMNKQNLAFFFLNILCPITFISALIGILQYTKILSFSIQIIGTILSKINGMGKIESFNAISSLFLGQSENFIIYKNIMPHITEKCMYTMAATAMSTVSLSIVGAYMTLLPPKYVVVALILNMFSTFIVLSILNPHSVNEEKNYNLPILNIKNKKFFEVLNEYILIGFKIALTITAMLIGFIALISTFNFLFKILLGISFQEILGFLFLPFAWIIGIPTNEIFQISSIMATKLISNEFVAMINLQKISNNLSPQSIGILSVFLVSFANFSSIGIITGCIKELNKKQGNVISKYGLKLIYSSTLINLLSSTIAGLII